MFKLSASIGISPLQFMLSYFSLITRYFANWKTNFYYMHPVDHNGVLDVHLLLHEDFGA